MTRAEVKTLVRLYSRMSTVYVSDTDLEAYIARAEHRTALDLLEANPGLAYKFETFTYPANALGITLSTTYLAGLGTGRSVWKIIALGERTTDNLWYGLYSPAFPQELAGSGVPRNVGGDTATSVRWYTNGTELSMYPVPTRDIPMACKYTRVPVPATTDVADVLADFCVQGQQFSELIALRAAQMLVRDRGSPSAALDEQVADYEKRVNSLVGKFQLQENATFVGVRYDTAADA